MQTQITKNSLFHYFSGNATALQKKVIEEWLAQPANVETYFQWLEEWEREHPQFIPGTDMALQRLMQRMENDRTVPTLKPQYSAKKERRLNWLSYAAVVLIAVLAAAYVGRDVVLYKTYTTQYAEVKSFTLDDGSEVSLNANSTLRVPRFGFGETTRRVLLEGEAEFSVVHKKDDQKFLVHTPDNLEIEVVGTEFIVFSRSRGSRVILNKGRVLLRSLKDSVRAPLAIRPGDVVTVKDGVFELKHEQPVREEAEWKDHLFIFDHTSLEQIGYQLEDNFGLEVTIPNKALARREITGTYEAANAEELLTVLSQILDIEVKQYGKRVTLLPKQN